jgi:hypothetical protein
LLQATVKNAGSNFIPPLAQLDRAAPSEGAGRRFDSCRVDHFPFFDSYRCDQFLLVFTSVTKA